MTAGSFTSQDGCRLAFDAAGSGRPVLWQHGLGAPLAQPVEVFPTDSGLQRITLMCRGHGDSDLGDPSRLTIPQFAEDALALLDHLGIEAASVGGISLGAAIALRLVSLHPDRVTRAVLARPAWVDAPSLDRQRAYVQAARHLQLHGAEEGKRLFEQSEDFRAVQAASPDNAASLLSFFSRPRLDTTVALLSSIPSGWPGIALGQMAVIARPTLVIGNGQDFVHPLDYARTLAAAIPAAGLVEITSKTVDRDRYVREFRAALGAFLATGTSAS